ncbi:hypothetical protein AZ032_004965, partial [Klebsiella pneumoniae]
HYYNFYLFFRFASYPCLTTTY